MEMVKRYVYAVTKRLPEKQRMEVARELESDIEAMVSDKALGKEPSKKHIRSVLMDLGDPVVFAQQYNDGKRHLIGPAVYDMYLTLLRTLLWVVLPILGVIALVAGLIALHSIDKLIVESLGVMIEVGVHIFFWVTVIFIIFERSGMKHTDITKSVWTPDDLPELPVGRRIPKSEAINGIVWSSVGLLWVLWQIPSIHALSPLQNVPLFFASQMWPYWTIGLLVIAIITLAVEIIRLVVGVWNKLTVWLITFVNTLLILFVTALIVFVRPIINESFVAEVIHAVESPALMSVINTAGIALAVSIIVTCVWEIGNAWYKLKKVEG